MQATAGSGFGLWDVIIFIAFIAGVITLGLVKSRNKSDAKAEGVDEHKKNTKEFFLAGGSLTWWIIGFSLIAANISTEQFVGQSGQACDYLGMAIASYEWLAAITLVIVAFLFLPKFLKSGIFTIPEFLEYRFDSTSRVIMAICTMIVLVGCPTAAVIYGGATIMDIFFKGQSFLGIPINIVTSCWIISILATIYVFVGGLKACAWADLIQGSALIVGGAIVAYFAIDALGSADVSALTPSPDIQNGIFQGARPEAFTNADPNTLTNAGALERLWELNRSKFHMVLPTNDKTNNIPWTALILAGLWIPNFFYWGLNQYITQRTLAAKSVDEGQKGIIFAAFIKLIIPFIVIIIGILAFNLYNKDLQNESDWRTAEMIANVPALYETLSPATFRIDQIAKTDTVIAHDASRHINKIEETLAAKVADPNTYLFTFDPEGKFIEFHDIDAIKIYAHNCRELKCTPDSSLICYKNVEALVANANADVAPGEALKKIYDDNKISPKTTLDMSKYAVGFAKINNDMINKATAAMDEAKLKKTSIKSISGYNYDSTYGILLKRLIRGKEGIAGFVLAALFGAVVSSLASMLNSASTIFTLDIYHKIKVNASDRDLVWTGRVMIVIFMLIACFIAPILDNPKFGGVFSFIQEFQGFISPGILAIFIFGMLVHRAPRSSGIVGLLVCPVTYGFFKWGGMFFKNCDALVWIAFKNCDALVWIANQSFLDRMSMTFAVVLIVLTIMRLVAPMEKPVQLPVNSQMDMTSSRSTKIWGALVIILTLCLYVIFF